MSDDFEQNLQRQSLRQVPPEWRAEILAAAHDAQVVRQTPHITHRSWRSTINHQLSTLLWPHPKAWAGLAAVWVFILVLNFSMRDKSPALAEKSSPPSPEVIVQLKQQQRMFAELMGPRDPAVADRPKTQTPRPRSQCTEWQVG